MKNARPAKNKCTLRIALLTLVCVIGYACCFVYADELPRYEIDALLDTAAHTISATQKLVYTNNADSSLTEIYFHIYPHRKYSQREIQSMYRYGSYFKVNPFPEGFQSGDLKVESIASSAGPLAYSIEGPDQTIMKVVLGKPLLPGQSREIRIKFSVDIPHTHNRFGWHDGVITLTRWYPMVSVFDQAGWHTYPFYIYHQPFFSDAAYYRLRLRVPADQTVISGCSLVEETAHPDQTKTLVLESDGPMRDLGLGISARFDCFVRAEQGYEIRSYYIDGRKETAQRAAEHAAGLMRFYGQRFGTYPYRQFSIAPSFLGFGGDQSSGLVFLNTRLYHLPGFLRRYFDFLVSHETGHQWFYNMVGSDEYKEMFVDEGMNSYWLLRYLEEKYGSNAAVLEWPAWCRWLTPNFTFRSTGAMRYLFLVKNGYDRRPVLDSLSNFTQPVSIFALAYGKGSAFLEMLEKKIGRSIFDRFVARYAREYRFKNIRVENMLRLAEEESGQDLTAFFEQWLKTNKFCDFAVKKVTGREVVVQNRGTLTMPVTVRLAYTDGTTEDAQWDGTAEKGVPAAESKRLKHAAVDPDNAVVLDIDRTNNYWPRKLRLQPVPLYFFAYELPVMLDRDAVNTFAGPSVGGSSLGAAASVQQPYDNIARCAVLYDFSDEAVDSRLGYEFRHLFDRHNALGFEMFDFDSRKQDKSRTGGKIYFRRELWPVNYSAFGTNNHATMYLIRDQELNRRAGFDSREDVRNLPYRKHDQAIAGLTGSIGAYGPHENPMFGFRFIPTAETAGHFLGGKEDFWRASSELQRYHLLFPRLGHTLAARVKLGWGEDSDKNLFYLGGAEGLRGYDSKSLEGAHMALAGLEYRLPLYTKQRFYFLDNILCLHTIQGVGFVDAGKAWFASFRAQDFKKDAGLGVRLHFDLAGPLEQLVVRIDVARAINDPRQDTHVWFGINQSF